MAIFYIIAALLAAILITMLDAWGFAGGAVSVILVLGLMGAAAWVVWSVFLDLLKWVIRLSERAWQALNHFLGKIPLKTFRARELNRQINKMHQLRYSYGDEKQQQELAELEQALKEIESGK